MQINVRSNTKQVLAELTASQRQISKATVQALNRTADRLRTQSGRVVRSEYNVTLRAIRQVTKINKARSGTKYPRAEVIYTGKRINLAEFGAKPRNPWNVPGRKRKGGGGVTVKVKHSGGRKLIAGAFMTTLKSGQNTGRLGVFRRVGKSRYPIKFAPSLSIPQMVGARAIEKVLLEFGSERFTIEFDAALRNQLRLAGRQF